MTIMKNIPAFVWLLIIPLIASPLIYFGGRFDRENQNKEKFPLAQLISLIFLLGTGVVYVRTIFTFLSGQKMVYEIGKLSLQADGIGLVLAGLVLFLGILVVFYSSAYMSMDRGQEKYYANLSLMIGVIIALGFSTDLFNLWVWFEAMAISSYLLVAFYHEQPKSIEAGIKYLVQSASGSVLILLGIALLYAHTGSLSLIEIAQYDVMNSVMLGAGALFLAGFGIKAAFVPMHTWLPDAHSMSPSGISAMLSGVVIEAGLIALLRILGAMNNAGETPWGAILLAIGAINMIVGNLMALRQKEIKRMFAYSSLAHIGYMVIGFGVTLMTNNTIGASGGFFHMFTHGMMKGLAFLAAGTLLFVLHLRKGSHKALVVDDLNGAATKYPWTALFLSLAVLSLGGIPPLAGFMSKWQIFSAGFGAHLVVTDLLILFAGLNSVLSLAYYAPLINRMYRKEPSVIVKNGAKVPFQLMVPLVILAIGLIVIGIVPSMLSFLTNAAGAALVLGF